MLLSRNYDLTTPWQKRLEFTVTVRPGLWIMDAYYNNFMHVDGQSDHEAYLIFGPLQVKACW